jgi:hypothetical protein
MITWRQNLSSDKIGGMFDGEIYLVNKPQDSTVFENVWQWRERFVAILM